MIADIEFLKGNEVVFSSKQDLGILSSPSPFASIAYFVAKTALDNAVQENKVPQKAKDWDTLRVAGKSYSRPKESPSPRSGSAPPKP